MVAFDCTNLFYVVPSTLAILLIVLRLRSKRPRKVAREVLACAQKHALQVTKCLDLANGIKLELTLIPSGSFLMGSPPTQVGRSGADAPQHQVTIHKPFYMGVFAVTQEQYAAVTGKEPSRFKGPRNPVEEVSWVDVQEFCRKASQTTGHIVRLPTEAEWEYSCRAGSTTKYSCGDSVSKLDGVAWYDANSNEKTHPVGEKKPNAWGLYDIHGNVWEWCEDDWHRDYNGAPADGGPWTSDPRGKMRVLRGGSWDANFNGCRCACRDDSTPRMSMHIFGFRVVVAASVSS